MKKNLNIRSNMMVNPLNLAHLYAIEKSEADMITLNLEDGIAPSRKAEALENIAGFLSSPHQSRAFIVVRTNPLDLGGKEEITFLNDFTFDAIRVAKIRTQEEIDFALSLLCETKALHISVETKEAFAHLSQFKGRRLTTAHLGILDLLSDLGLPHSLVQLANPTIDYILSKFLIESKIAGLNALSFMFQDYNDTSTFTQWCEREKHLGFEGKACLGPKQTAIANKVFGIDDQAKRRALHIKEAFETQSQKGINGFMDALYGFIDEPIYRDSLLILKENN